MVFSSDFRYFCPNGRFSIQTNSCAFLHPRIVLPFQCLASPRRLRRDTSTITDLNELTANVVSAMSQNMPPNFTLDRQDLLNGLHILLGTNVEVTDDYIEKLRKNPLINPSKKEKYEKIIVKLRKESTPRDKIIGKVRKQCLKNVCTSSCLIAILLSF